MSTVSCKSADCLEIYEKKKSIFRIIKWLSAKKRSKSFVGENPFSISGWKFSSIKSAHYQNWNEFFQSTFDHTNLLSLEQRPQNSTLFLMCSLKKFSWYAAWRRLGNLHAMTWSLELLSGMNRQYQINLNLLEPFCVSAYAFQSSNHSPSTLIAPSLCEASRTTINLCANSTEFGNSIWRLVKGHYWCLPTGLHIYGCLNHAQRMAY